MVNKYNPDIHHRRSIRLRDYDYSQAGAYFVTICTWNRECIFGEISNGEIILNVYGEIVMKCWDATPGHFVNVECDYFVIMPNHVHGVIILSNVGAQLIAPFRKTTAEKRRLIHWGLINQAPTKNNNDNQGVMNHAPIGKIVRVFKARCTHMINDIRKTPHFPVWQRNYYEHIIRNDDELNRIREYIINNQLQWAEDENNPVNINVGVRCNVPLQIRTK